MKAFAALLDRLVYTPGRNAKLRLMVGYFRSVPDPDRGWALAALTDGLPFSFPVRRTLADLMAKRLDPELFRLSRDYVGDTAETVALVWPEPESPAAAPRLADVVADLALIDKRDLGTRIETWLDGLDATERWALLKLLTGALRVGVSGRLAKTALAEMAGRNVDEIEEIWHGLSPPYTGLFAWLDGHAAKPDITGAPVFRPLMLSHPLEDADLANLDPADISAEWKWDGIRVQIAAGRGEARLYSRTGDDIGQSFPDIVRNIRFEGVLDGELLVKRGADIAPFNDLQQRLNRKAVTKRMMEQYPAHIRLYDALLLGDDDLRALPFVERRARLEAWFATARPQSMDLSELVTFSSKAALEDIWRTTRGIGIEGLMLKRRDSPYLAGRPKGHWWKWKRAALTVDCVLMYAQRGSGKRSSYHSDFTFGAWRERADGTRELVPVGKAYSGYTDAELLQIDRWIRNHTVDRFGPVRSVTPELVLEVAFDAIQRSSRHKSGVAMRFPRISRIRWDKPAAEADLLATLEKLIAGVPADALTPDLQEIELDH
jgi:DNA ligase 1